MTNRELAFGITSKMCETLGIDPSQKMTSLLVDVIEETINAAQQARAADGAWTCPKCGTWQGTGITQCWNCNTPQPRR